jgi:hypothetical protein
MNGASGTHWRTLLFISVPLCLCGSLQAGPPERGQYFQIKVIDEQTGRGVPLVELSTTHNLRLYTDSQGVVAFYEPGLLDQDVYFHVKSHGYEYPQDGFGYRGRGVRITAGGSAEFKVKRINIAQRLYRITGGGIYRDSELLGLPVPLEKPVLNGLVFGSDSVLETVYRGKLFWLWGDTNRPAYPLGNFHASGATSLLPSAGGLDPDVGVNLSYWVDDQGFARGMADVPGDGAIWLDSLVVLPDADARERMYAAFARVRSLAETLERGFVEFNDATERFEKIAEFDINATVYPGGHPVAARVGETEYLYFARPFLLTRVPATRSNFLDITKQEAFTCLKEGTRPEDQQVERAADGGIQYGWKRNTPALGMREEAELVKAGVLKPEESLLQCRDVETGKTVLMHGGSVYWNAFRGRWILIATEAFGTSMLGEIWYAEADTPVGPWVYARKVITHDAYSFYNPKQHPVFNKDGGRVIYFEGTYTTLFSGNPTPTPFYEYNQIMYKLDLADPRLVLPVPIYQLCAERERFTCRKGAPVNLISASIAFFACDRPTPGLVPIYSAPSGSRSTKLIAGAPTTAPEGSAAPVFYALPPGAAPDRSTVVALHEFVSPDGNERTYAASDDPFRPAFTRIETPVCYVWRNPLSPTIRFPLSEARPLR